MGSDPIPPWWGNQVEVPRGRIEDLKQHVLEVKRAYCASGERGDVEKNAQLRLKYIEALERLAHTVVSTLREVGVDCTLTKPGGNR